MAGLLGVYRFDGNATEADEELVRQMVAASEEPAHYALIRRVGSLCAAYLGYGFEQDVQADHVCVGAGGSTKADVEVLFTGYLFNDREIQAAAPSPRPKTIVEGIRELYARHDDAFVERLEGRFQALVYDQRKKRLILGSDRFGHVPLYTRQTSDTLVFATSLIAHQVRSAPALTLDRSAIALYLMYRHFIGQGTYFEQVKLPPIASIISVQRGEVSRRQYWQYRFHESPPWRDAGEHANEMADAFVRSMARVAREPGKMAVPLSGGLDSRAIAGQLHRLRRDFSAFTFGREGSRDVAIAKQVTRLLDVPHDIATLRPDYLVQKAALIARRTDGAYPVDHGHVATTLDAICPDHTVAVDGFTGEILSSEKVTNTRARIEEHRVLELVSKYYQTTPDEHMRSLLPNLPSKAELAASAGTAISAQGHQLAASVIDLFSLEQRQRRFTLNGPRILGGDTRVFCPFWHYDYANACFDVSPQDRSVQRPYVLMHRQLWPDLARLRWNKTGLPPLAPVPLLRASIYVDTALSWLYEKARTHVPQLPKEGLLKGFESYNKWFKEDASLRGFVRDILLDPRTLNRAIYAPTAIRQTIEDHEAGRARSADLLSLLMGTELFFRQIDALRGG